MANKDVFSSFVPEPPAEQRRAHKDKLNRIRAYWDYMDAKGQDLDQPDLEAYNEFLLKERKLAPTSVNAHIYTVRNWYRELLDDGAFREALARLIQNRTGATPSAMDIENSLARIRAAIASRGALLDAERPEVEYRRLQASHIKTLLASPNLDSPVGKRDVAIFALMLTTGLRASEVCALHVKDLHSSAPTGPALHVPKGRGCTERVIPYRRLSWGIDLVDSWLKGPEDPEAREKGRFPITTGPVFRGFYRGGQVPRSEGLSPRSLDYIFKSYPIEFAGEQITVRPMELRRTYARLLFNAKFELEAIKERLGITDNNTLMDYIGGREAQLMLPPGTDVLEEATWFDN